MEKLIKKQNPNIRSMIYHIRGKYVMLDSDLALLYGYEPKRLNEQVQRNIERFPEDFMFKLTREEEENLKSQIATSSYTKLDHGGKRKPSTVFTEQGVYALSGILKGPLATIMSIHLIRTFKELKDFYNENNNLLDRVIDLEVTSKNIDNSLIEYKNDTNRKFDEIFTYISKHKKIKEKIFYRGQIYESYSLIGDLIRSANKQIILIDNYINKDTLDILVNKNENVSINIYTSYRGCRITKLDLSKFNNEHSSLIIYKTDEYHDRFLIIDNKDVYLIGASLKDAGFKTFGIIEIIDKKTKIKLMNNLL